MVLHVFTAWSSYSVFSGELSVRDFPFTQVGCAKAKRARHGPFNYPALRGQLVPSAETQVAFCFFTLDPSPRAIFSCVALTCIASCLVTAMWTVPWYADQAKCACCLRHRRIPHELLMFVSSTSFKSSTVRHLKNSKLCIATSPKVFHHLSSDKGQQEMATRRFLMCELFVFVVCRSNRWLDHFVKQMQRPVRHCRWLIAVSLVQGSYTPRPGLRGLSSVSVSDWFFAALIDAYDLAIVTKLSDHVYQVWEFAMFWFENLRSLRWNTKYWEFSPIVGLAKRCLWSSKANWSSRRTGSQNYIVSVCVCVATCGVDDSRCHAVFDVTRFCRKSWKQCLPLGKLIGAERCTCMQNSMSCIATRETRDSTGWWLSIGFSDFMMVQYDSIHHDSIWFIHPLTRVRYGKCRKSWSKVGKVCHKSTNWRLKLWQCGDIRWCLTLLQWIVWSCWLPTAYQFSGLFQCLLAIFLLQLLWAS